MRGGWFYRTGSNRVGPMPLGALQNLIRSGQLGPNVEVWTERMPRWLPARNLPAFNPVAQRAQGMRPLHVAGLVLLGLAAVAVVAGSSDRKTARSEPPPVVPAAPSVVSPPDTKPPVGTRPTDENKPCSVAGTQGVCLPIASCSGTHTPGYCPYSPDGIQCCTPAAPAIRSEPIAPAGLQCCDGTMSPTCGCGGSHRGCCSHHGGVCGCR